MPKVVISYGHGSNTYETKHSKFVNVGGEVYEEHTHNYKVGLVVKSILLAHGVDVMEVQPPNGSDVPLATRTSKANNWKADLYWSIHSNAGTKDARGWCGFYWSTSAEGKKIAQLYAKEVAALGLPLYSGDGIYPSQKGTWSDFHELRESHMVACLTENGFMTNPEDFKYIFLGKNDYYNKMGTAHAKAILAYFKIAYKATTPKPAPKPVTKPVPKPVTKPAPKGNMTTGSIVEYLGSIGADASFANRAKLADKHGIKGYTGTADQNAALLKKMRSGATPVAAKPVVKGDQKTASLVDYLKSIGESSSMSNRQRLATKYGIRGYQGTASQNTQLLGKMRGH